MKDLKELKSEDYDVVLIPGGFGAAKNLSDYAFKGKDMGVAPEIERVLKDFHSNKKPIGLACIAPIVAARVFGQNFGGPGVTITLGGMMGSSWPYAETVEIA